MERTSKPYRLTSALHCARHRISAPFNSGARVAFGVKYGHKQATASRWDRCLFEAGSVFRTTFPQSVWVAFAGELF